uniref:Secreted protein n=1 Tax=Steinernema glaseri TaxID=37863 RepID=A0A1I7ZQY4_9BILA
MFMGGPVTIFRKRWAVALSFRVRPSCGSSDASGFLSRLLVGFSFFLAVMEADFGDSTQHRAVSFSTGGSTAPNVGFD